jgi:DNA-binding NarL/FixJ family response regulator
MEESIKVASGLPNARLLVTDGAWQLGDSAQGLTAIDEFVAHISTQLPPNVASAADGSLARLSPRERQVLKLLALGKRNREVAAALVLSERTVQRHIANIYKKIGARNRAEATAFAFTHS